MRDLSLFQFTLRMASYKEIRSAYQKNDIDLLNRWCFEGRNNIFEWIEKVIPRRNFYLTIFGKRLFGFVFGNPDFPVEKIPNLPKFINQFLQTNYPLRPMNIQLNLPSELFVDVDTIDKYIWLCQFTQPKQSTINLPFINPNCVWDYSDENLIVEYFEHITVIRSLKKKIYLPNYLFDIAIKQQSKKKFRWLMQYIQPTARQMAAISIDFDLSSFGPVIQLEYALLTNTPYPPEILSHLSIKSIINLGLKYENEELLEMVPAHHFSPENYLINPNMIDYIALRYLSCVILTVYLLDVNITFFEALLRNADQSFKIRMVQCITKQVALKNKDKYCELLRSLDWTNPETKYIPIFDQVIAYNGKCPHLNIFAKNMSTEILLDYLQRGFLLNVSRTLNEHNRNLYETEPIIQRFRRLRLREGNFPITTDMLPELHPIDKAILYELLLRTSLPIELLVQLL